MVDAVKQLMEKEPASGQIWEAYALDSLETAEIACDDCRIPVEKTVRKTGVRIQCKKCGKWLALKNSKVTIINPSRAELEEWEK
jgi:Zn finger protein HypA/HybF involved in hydrogenase expression